MTTIKAVKKLTKAQLTKFLTEPPQAKGLSHEQEVLADNFYDRTCVSCHRVIDKDNTFKDNFNHVTTHYFQGDQKEAAICYLLKHQPKEAMAVFFNHSTDMWFENPMEDMLAFNTSYATDFFLKNISRHRKILIKLTKSYPFYVLSKILNNAPHKQTAQSRFLMEQFATHTGWEQALRQHCTENQVVVLDRLLTFDDSIEDEKIENLPEWLTGEQQWETKPAIPRSLYFPSLPKLILEGTERAIPVEYLKTVLQLCSFSSIDKESNGLTTLKESVTEQSLAVFNRELFQWYDSQGRPSKYRWMFINLGHTGNDETARLLAKTCKDFRTNLNRIGAYDALTMLGQIGSDSALMYVNDFTTIKRYQDIRERADEALDAIAKKRKLTREQLADRTVPNLGLDHNGKLELDFGSRTFIVGFNEFLQPLIYEAETGKIRKTLPKPSKKDDALLAKEATQTFKDLKKQLKTVSSMQVKRLEQAMNEQRRWSFEDFNQLLVKHPLMRHLVQRLAWGLYKEGKGVKGLFRVTEELTFTNEHDDDLDIETLKDYQIGVAHPIKISEQLAGEFGQVLQDYELLQPFEQLARQVYRYQESDTNDTGNELIVWNKKCLTIASLYGLQAKGWEREVGDNGLISSFGKQIISHKKHYTIKLYVVEGWHVYEYPETSRVQVVEGVSINSSKDDSIFSQLSAIAYSEIMRDLHAVAWFE